MNLSLSSGSAGGPGWWWKCRYAHPRPIATLASVQLTDGEALECATILWSSAFKRPLSGIEEAISAIGFVQEIAHLVHSETTPETFALFRAWMGEDGEQRSVRALVRTQGARKS